MGIRGALRARALGVQYGGIRADESCAHISRSSEKLLDHPFVNFHGCEEFFFGYAFFGGVGHVNTAGSEQKRLAPGVIERGDVGGVGDDRGGEAVERLEAHRENGNEFAGCDASRCDALDGGADVVTVIDEANGDLSAGGVGDYVGRLAAGDYADVESAAAQEFVVRQRNFADVLESVEELVYG